MIRISAALDDRRALPNWLRKRLNCSDDLRHFEQGLRAMDQALRHAPVKPEVTASFHDSIMRAVRAAEMCAVPQHKHSILRWLPAPALVALTVLGVWYALHQPVPATVQTPVPNTQSLAATATALEMSDLVVRDIPSAVLRPLSEEWARVNLDMDNTAQFLLASLP